MKPPITISAAGLTDKFKPPETKVCRLCKQELPIKNFSLRFKGKHGYANECRGCKKKHEDQKVEQRKEYAKTFFDAKFFLLFILFSGSLDSFSQDAKKTCGHNLKNCKCMKVDVVKPDTLRAIILVTMSPNGIARSRMGYVVIEQGKRPVYLDCRKRALKLPQVGWGYVEVNPNEKLK